MSNGGDMVSAAGDAPQTRAAWLKAAALVLVVAERGDDENERGGFQPCRPRLRRVPCRRNHVTAIAHGLNVQRTCLTWRFAPNPSHELTPQGPRVIRLGI